MGDYYYSFGSFNESKQHQFVESKLREREAWSGSVPEFLHFDDGGHSVGR